jgi:hypothetical protein
MQTITEKRAILVNPDLFTNKTFKKYYAMVTKVGYEFKEQEIISLRSYIRKNKDGCAKILLNAFYTSLETQDFTLTKEQQDKGIEWLMRTQFLLKGGLRKNAFVGSREAEILKNYSHFTFSGLRGVGTGFYAFYVPVYRCHAKDASSFEYSTNMCQCEVLS